MDLRVLWRRPSGQGVAGHAAQLTGRRAAGRMGSPAQRMMHAFVLRGIVQLVDGC